MTNDPPPSLALPPNSTAVSTPIAPHIPLVHIALHPNPPHRFSAKSLILPLICSLILLIPTVLYWAHERAVADEFQQSRVAQGRQRFTRRIQTEVAIQLRPLRRLSDEISTGDVTSPQAFASSARSICREEPALKYIAWIAPDGHCLSAFPADAAATVSNALSADTKDNPQQLMTRLARTPDGLLLTLPNDPNWQSSDRVILLPIKADVLLAHNLIEGAIVTCESTHAMLGELLLPDAGAPFIVEVKDERGRLLLASDGASSPDAQRLLKTADVAPIPVLDQSWSLLLAAAPPGLGQRPSTDTDAFLLSGVIVALIGGAAVAQAGRHRRRERQRTADHLAALESLHAVAASISRKPRTQSEVFDRLLDAACQLLHVKIALVIQLDGDRIRIARQVGFYPPLDWESGLLADFPMIERCARTGELLTIEDAEAELTAPQFAAMRRRDIVSMLAFPLAAGEERIGVLALCDEKPRHFSPEELRLARLWASQAAVTLANQRLAAANDEALQQEQRLNQQVRQDADAKAMLLRELNHRVKNNLAGIVGLLSAGCPELSEPAQQWLDRAIARIETLARAHELFVGNNSELSLADLITKTLEPIWAIKPACVQIKLDLASASDPLSTDQAVTLAMVVHELASNALQHGLSDHGILCVQACRSRPGSMMLQISDDGTAACDDKANTETGDRSLATLPPRSASRGIGLQLVRGLVGRELHGVFFISENISGGTVATIEFPMSSTKMED